MSKRIRYVATTDPDIVRSQRNFLGNQDGLYQVKINTKELTYRIVNVRTKKTIKSTEKDGRTPPKTLRTVYEQAKKSLKSLGVKFEHDFRGL
jgi:hypothetical protein